MTVLTPAVTDTVTATAATSDTLGVELTPAFPDLLTSVIRCAMVIVPAGVIRCGQYRCGAMDPQGWLFPIIPEVI